MSVHTRKVRYRQFERVRYSDRLLDFLALQAARLSGSGTGLAITFTNFTNLVNAVGHGYVDGQGPFLLANAGGALPAELDAVTEYWVNDNDGNSFTLHTNEADAIAGTNPVAFTDDGTGTHETLVAAESRDIFDALLSGKSSEEIEGLSSIDNL